MAEKQENIRIQDAVCAVILLPSGNVVAHLLLYFLWLFISDTPVNFSDEELYFWANILGVPLTGLGCIALVRTIAPDRFFDPSIRGIGMAPPQGRWVLETATAFLLVQTVIVSINMLRMSHGETGMSEFEEFFRSLEGLKQTVFFINMSTLGPAVEELIFRGILIGAIAARFGTVSAVLTSTVLFTAIHLPGADLYSVGQLASLGLAASLLRVRTGSLLPPILLHAIYNFLGGSIILLDM